MGSNRTITTPALALSLLTHAALLAAGASATLVRATPAAHEPATRRPGSVGTARKAAASARIRRVEAARAEQRAEERPWIVLRGAGTAEHSARASGGIPGLPRPSARHPARADAVRLPALEPDQLQNPREAEAPRSERRAAERRPLQSPEMPEGFGVFVSALTAARMPAEAGRPAAALSQAAAASTQAARVPRAEPAPQTPASGALAPPPGTALAASPPRLEPAGQQALEEAEPETSVRSLAAVHEPTRKPTEARAGSAPEVTPRARSAPPRGIEPLQTRLLATMRSRLPETDNRAAAKAAPATSREGEDERSAGDRARRESPEESRTARSLTGRTPRPAEAAAEGTDARERRLPVPPDEPPTALSDRPSDGLWLAPGRSEDQPESGAPREPEHRVAEGRPQEQPVSLAVAARPRLVGAGDDDARVARLYTLPAPSARDSVTRTERRLDVSALERSEQGAHLSERSTLSVAAPEPALVGESGGEVREAAPQAGRIVIAPEGDGSGDDLGAASIMGNADLRRLVQERVNHVVGLLASSVTARAGSGGVAIVRLRVDERGYLRAVRLERSTGSELLDRELEPVLRLAEPYPGVGGWLRVAIAFERPAVDP